MKPPASLDVPTERLLLFTQAAAKAGWIEGKENARNAVDLARAVRMLCQTRDFVPARSAVGDLMAYAVTLEPEAVRKYMVQHIQAVERVLERAKRMTT